MAFALWFKPQPGTLLPLWTEWDPMVVMISRSVGSAMFGAFPIGYYVLPRASFIKEATLLNALYLGFFISGSFAQTAVVETFRLLLIPAALLTSAGIYVLFTEDLESFATKPSLTDAFTKSDRVSKSIGLNSETCVIAHSH